MCDFCTIIHIWMFAYTLKWWFSAFDSSVSLTQHSLNIRVWFRHKLLYFECVGGTLSSWGWCNLLWCRCSLRTLTKTSGISHYELNEKSRSFSSHWVWEVQTNKFHAHSHIHAQTLTHMRSHIIIIYMYLYSHIYTQIKSHNTCTCTQHVVYTHQNYWKNHSRKKGTRLQGYFINKYMTVNMGSLEVKSSMLVNQKRRDFQSEGIDAYIMRLEKINSWN